MSVFITAIEIGSSKIKGAVGTIGDDKKLNVIAIEECPLAPGAVRYGCVVNVEEVNKSVNRIKRQLENNPRISPRKITGAYVALGGRSMSSHLTETTKSFPHETEITESIIGEMKEQVRRSPSSLKEILDIVPVSYNVDGQNIGNPVGTLGFQLRIRYNMVVCDEKNRRNIKLAFEKSGLKLMAGISRILAIDTLLLTKDQRTLGCAIIDFGAETTTVAVYKDNSLRFLSTLPMGSRMITRDLAKVLNVSEERAEELKLNHVNLARKAESGDKIERTLDNLDYNLINNVAQARASEIISNIAHQISSSGLKPEELTEGMIVVGKGSRLSGFKELMQKNLNLKIAGGAGVPIQHEGFLNVPVEEALDVLAVLTAVARSGQAKECTELTTAPEPVVPEPVTPPEGKKGDDGKKKDKDKDKGSKSPRFLPGLLKLISGDDVDFDPDSE